MPAESLKGLPKKAKEIWEAVFQSCTDKGDSEEACAQKAWGAVKKQYKKDGDKWVKKSLTEMRSEAGEIDFSNVQPTDEVTMHFAKTSISGGKFRYVLTSSDIEEDRRGDNTSRELFESFIETKDERRPVYLSIAHYFDYPIPDELKSDLGDRAVAGYSEEHWIDGNKFKAKGYFTENKLGIAALKSIRSDDEEQPDNRCRVSLGFIDLEHEHKTIDYTFVRQSMDDACIMCALGYDGKVFKRGVLVHEALTRVPVNPRTEVELEEMSDTTEIRSRKDDAAAVLKDEELAEILDKLASGDQVHQSFVTHSEEDVPVETAAVETKAMGPTSYREALDVKDAEGKVNEAYKAWAVLDDVIWNIKQSDDVDDKAGAISEAFEEYKDHVASLAAAEGIAMQKNQQTTPAEDRLAQALEAFSQTVRGLDKFETKEEAIEAFNTVATQLNDVAQEQFPEGYLEQPEEEPEVETRSDADAVKAAIAEVFDAKITPLAQKVELLSTQVARQQPNRRAGEPPSPVLIQNPMQQFSNTGEQGQQGTTQYEQGQDGRQSTGQIIRNQLRNLGYNVPVPQE